MTMSYQIGDVDAHGATIRTQVGALWAEHQAGHMSSADGAVWCNWV
jgi:hypothetical protein